MSAPLPRGGAAVRWLSEISRSQIHAQNSSSVQPAIVPPRLDYIFDRSRIQDLLTYVAQAIDIPDMEPVSILAAAGQPLSASTDEANDVV